MKNKDNLIVKVSTLEDIDLITNNTKYINIDITNPNTDIINFFLKNGEKYLYSEIINKKCGYVYVSYNEFFKSENIINGIYAGMPNDLTKLEMARYLYTAIPKFICFDINSNSEKNDNYNLNLINSINNLWGSLYLGRVTDKSISKIFYYMCRRLDIQSDIISSITNDTYVKININKIELITDIFLDIPFVQGKMKTKHFGTYNDDTVMDKKIKYIKSKYNDELIDKELKNIDYTSSNCIEEILTKTEKILNISSIKPTELSIIYKDIFDKYCPNYNIKINNLFLNNKSKSHFIIISYGDEHYSYNYKKNNFVRVNNDDIKNNIALGRIGIYLNEFIPNVSNG